MVILTAGMGFFHAISVAQPGGSPNKTKILIHHLENWYNAETGLWETTSWWNAANILTAIIRNGQLTKNDAFIEIVENTFEKTKRFEVPADGEKEAWICTNYINDYYDDEGWWALAWLDAWEWTGKQEYLEMARRIFEDISTGWDSTCGGGIYWKKGLSNKATISSELTMLLAARLHLAETGAINGKSCLKWSLDIWNWILTAGLINDINLVQDGLGKREGKCTLNSRIWTYNQGVILSGLVYLHKISKDPSYLEHAHSIAMATINQMVNNDGVLFEKGCEPAHCNGDADQFKGVFMRHLAVLNQYASRVEYIDFINHNAASIWGNAMQAGSQAPGVSWSIFSEKSTAATVSSALDALNAALSCEK
jgi:predicted alpha-1,6-mannanase (GH76 family)